MCKPPILTSKTEQSWSDCAGFWISLAKPAATHLNTWKLYGNAKKTIRLFQDTPLYPRTKGFIATVKKLGLSGRMQVAHDLTLAYTHHDPFFEAPTIWKTLPQPDLDKDWRFHVYVKRFELEERAGRQICRPSNGYSAST